MRPFSGALAFLCECICFRKLRRSARIPPLCSVGEACLRGNEVSTAGCGPFPGGLALLSECIWIRKLRRSARIPPPRSVGEAPFTRRYRALQLATDEAPPRVRRELQSATKARFAGMKCRRRGAALFRGASLLLRMHLVRRRNPLYPAAPCFAIGDGRRRELQSASEARLRGNEV